MEKGNLEAIEQVDKVSKLIAIYEKNTNLTIDEQKTLQDFKDFLKTVEGEKEASSSAKFDYYLKYLTKPLELAFDGLTTVVVSATFGILALGLIPFAVTFKMVFPEVLLEFSKISFYRAFIDSNKSVMDAKRGSDSKFSDKGSSLLQTLQAFLYLYQNIHDSELYDTYKHSLHVTVQKILASNKGPFLIMSLLISPASLIQPVIESLAKEKPLFYKKLLEVIDNRCEIKDKLFLLKEALDSKNALYSILSYQRSNYGYYVGSFFQETKTIQQLRLMMNELEIKDSLDHSSTLSIK